MALSSAASSSPPPRPWTHHGFGRWPIATSKTARRRTATSRRARPRWRRSPRAGGENIDIPRDWRFPVLTIASFARMTAIAHQKQAAPADETGAESMMTPATISRASHADNWLSSTEPSDRDRAPPRQALGARRDAHQAADLAPRPARDHGIRETTTAAEGAAAAAARRPIGAAPPRGGARGSQERLQSRAAPADGRA